MWTVYMYIYITFVTLWNVIQSDKQWHALNIVVNSANNLYFHIIYYFGVVFMYDWMSVLNCSC